MDVRGLVIKYLENFVQNKNIFEDYYIYKDLKIYGDDFEELIEGLSSELKFNIYDFFELFEERGFYNPPETYIKLPKIFYLDLRKLLKGEIVYRIINDIGKDITVGELIKTIEYIINT